MDADSPIPREYCTAGTLDPASAPAKTWHDGGMTRTLLLVSLVCLAAALPSQRQRGAQRTPSTEAIMRRVPDGVELRADIAYREGNPAWRLDLALPKEKADAPRPGIVFVHGGGWRAGDKRRGYFIRGALDYASQGYVCISVNYRLSPEAPFPACVEDVKCAVRWFRAHAQELQLDPKRIGGYGNSAGAHLVAMLGLCGKDAKLEGDGPYQDQSSLFQAVCAAATPTDFPNWPKGLRGFGRQGGLLGGSADTLEDRAKAASPVTYAHPNAPPFLLIHGTADRVVPVSQGELLEKALREAGARNVTLMKIEGAGHGVFMQKTIVTHGAMRSFFDSTIGPMRNVRRARDEQRQRRRQGRQGERRRRIR